MLLKPRLFIAASLLAMPLSFALAAGTADFAPPPPDIEAGSWVLMDYTTGQLLTAGNEHQQRNPASLTKLMTGYVVDRAIDSHRITPDDMGHRRTRRVGEGQSGLRRFLADVPERR